MSADALAALFTRPPDRRGGDSTKWNRYGGRDVLPMWVADMDFQSPPAVLDALQARVAHGVLGYAEPWPGLLDAVVEGVARETGWTLDRDALVWLPGLVTGLNIACRTVGRDGDAVLTATPVYPPFLSAPTHAHRRCVRLPLREDAAGWTWDFDALRAAAAASPGALLLLCHPHNPVGRVWRDDELARLAEIVLAHDLIVCSDEIHCGLVLDPAVRHQPFAARAPELAARTITLMAPSKTYNVAGLGCAFAVIDNPDLRRRFRQAMAGIVSHPGPIGYVACEAAYRHGEAWRQALLPVLRRNADVVLAAVRALPPLAMQPVEATYLAWIDARGLGVDDPVAHFEAAGLGLSDGRDFGLPGFVRLNFGCSPTLLDEALRRLAAAVRVR